MKREGLGLKREKKREKCIDLIILFGVLELKTLVLFEAFMTINSYG